MNDCLWRTEMQWLHAQVMSRVPLSLAPTVGPVHLTHARGYLFLAAPTGVAVFNTTGFDNRRGPKMVLAHPYSNVASDLAPDGMVSWSLHVLLEPQMQRKPLLCFSAQSCFSVQRSLQHRPLVLSCTACLCLNELPRHIISSSHGSTPQNLHTCITCS